MSAVRKIIHIDMDAFFAAIEQRDNPDYQGLPLAVGGSSKRGVISAASYEARRYGVRSAISTQKALMLCPELILVPPRFEAYKSASQEIMQIFHDYTDWVEPLSLDEAFLDVSQNKKGMRSATQIAEEIKKRIKKETMLTASAGVSFNKFLAKIASDYQKPDGLFVITPKEGQAFVEQLAIEKFFGVGRVTAQKMHQHNIYFGKDLKQWSLHRLTQVFGKAGLYFYNVARAIDKRPVKPHRIRKSISAEYTFEQDLEQIEALEEALKKIVKRLVNRLLKAKKSGYTLTIKVKYEDFQIITRSKTFDKKISEEEDILAISSEMLHQVERHKKIRLLGVGLSNLEDRRVQRAVQLKIPFPNMPRFYEH